MPLAFPSAIGIPECQRAGALCLINRGGAPGLDVRSCGIARETLTFLEMNDLALGC